MMCRAFAFLVAPLQLRNRVTWHICEVERLTRFDTFDQAHMPLAVAGFSINLLIFKNIPTHLSGEVNMIKAIAVVASAGCIALGTAIAVKRTHDVKKRDKKAQNVSLRATVLQKHVV